jgi:Na+/H+ antiporter NhaC
LEIPGLITLIPFVAGIFFLIWQEDVIFPIVGALFLGSIIASKFNLYFGFINTAGNIIAGALTNNANIYTIIIIAESLLLFSILNRAGFIHSARKDLSKKNLTKNRLEIIILLSNLALFIDRRLSAILTGIFSKPFAENKNLSPEKHAYLLNTVSSSVSTIIPFTTLIPFTIATIGTAFSGLGIGYSPIKAFYRSIPYQYFNIFSFFIAVSTVYLNKDMFIMKNYTLNFSNSVSRSQKRNNLSFGLNLNIKKQKNPQTALYGIAGSCLLTFAMICIGFIINRHGLYKLSILNIQNLQIIFISAIFTGIIFSFLFIIITKSDTYSQFKTKKNIISTSFITTFFYLILAMSTEFLAQRLGFSEALIKILNDNPFPVVLIPMIIFIFSSVISFLSGSYLFCISTVLPFAIKIIGLNMTDPLIVDNLLFATIGAVISGATFGDINSPLSLNFIIASASSESSVSKHFYSQIIYSLIAFTITIIFGYLLLIFNLRHYLSITSGLLVISLIFIFIDRK